MLTVQEAVARRDAFLRQKPYMEAFQAKINRALKEAGKPGCPERMEVLSRWMTGNLVVLGTQLNELAGAMKDGERTRTQSTDDD